MNSKSIIYDSKSDKTSVQALHYIKTHDSAHRFLAYRDIPELIIKYVKGKESLDYGVGTGSSVSFLLDQGFNVTGVDISKEMLLQTKLLHPTLSLFHIDNKTIPLSSAIFDLVFSSFVLFEMGTSLQLVDYLKEARRVMKNDGVFIGVTGSEELYSISRNWLSFRTNFPENKKLKSGKLVKLHLCEANMDFVDYYWTEKDYCEFFAEAGLEILEIHRPQGKNNEFYEWRDEMFSSPFLVIVAKKIIA